MMTEVMRIKIRQETTNAVSMILTLKDPHTLAAHEVRAANMLANSYVRRNRGALDDEDIRVVSEAANEIFLAVRVRRKELREGKTSLG